MAKRANTAAAATTPIIMYMVTPESPVKGVIGRFIILPPLVTAYTKADLGLLS